MRAFTRIAAASTLAGGLTIAGIGGALAQPADDHVETDTAQDAVPSAGSAEEATALEGVPVEAAEEAAPPAAPATEEAGGLLGGAAEAPGAADTVGSATGDAPDTAVQDTVEGATGEVPAT
ncbi:hypothetical protein, partial [Nocardiopsis sp. LOL_012]|uniref:hypothetical protein n=1 Tax=Nocardiopsis sp. LOL_012 TaxID=3345409 RepID=UPI003A8B64EF